MSRSKPSVEIQTPSKVNPIGPDGFIGFNQIEKTPPVGEVLKIVCKGCDFESAIAKAKSEGDLIGFSYSVKRARWTIEYFRMFDLEKPIRRE